MLRRGEAGAPLRARRTFVACCYVGLLAPPGGAAAFLSADPVLARLAQTALFVAKYDYKDKERKINQLTRDAPSK